MFFFFDVGPIIPSLGERLSLALLPQVVSRHWQGAGCKQASFENCFSGNFVRLILIYIFYVIPHRHIVVQRHYISSGMFHLCVGHDEVVQSSENNIIICYS